MLISSRGYMGQCFVSIKIVPADTSEARAFKYLMRCPQNYPGSRKIMKLLDHFTIHAPKRSYEGLVLEVMSQKTFRIMKCSSHGKIPPNNGREASRQVAMGLEYLHRCGICHGGWIPYSYRVLSAYYGQIFILETFAFRHLD